MLQHFFSHLTKDFMPENEIGANFFEIQDHDFFRGKHFCVYAHFFLIQITVFFIHNYLLLQKVQSSVKFEIEKLNRKLFALAKIFVSQIVLFKRRFFKKNWKRK